MLFEAHVVLLLGTREVLADHSEQLGLQVFHLAGSQLRPVIGKDQFQTFLDVVLAAPAAEETEHHLPPNRRRMPAMKPPCGSLGRKATSSPRMRRAMLRNAVPALLRLPVSRLAGLPRLVDTRICSSSGTMPMSFT